MKKNIKEQPLTSSHGFTLVEVLIAMLMGGVVMAAVMSSFQIQHRTYLAQDQVVEMQQNARLAMDMLVRDIRTVGYNPNNLTGTGITSVITAPGVASEITLVRDNGFGTSEAISYRLYSSGGEPTLGRQTIGTIQPAVARITQLEFFFLDANGDPTDAPNEVRAIQVSILAESANMANKTTPARPTYTTPSGASWQATPGFWNTYLSTTVQCRNLGLGP